MSKYNDIDNGDIEVIEFKLFDFLPIFKVVKNSKYELYSFLGLPLLKIKHMCQDVQYKLFYFLPILTILKRIKLPYKNLLHHYDNVLEKIKTKVQKGQKIRVGFMVIYDACFPAEPLFKKMLNDNLFEPHIIVIPDTRRGDENMMFQMNKTFETFSKNYSNVSKAWDDKNKTFIDFSEKFDIICTANPYEAMTHKFYRIGKLANNDVLPIYFNYGYPAVSFARRVASMGSLSKMWKVFSESDAIMDEYKEHMKNHGESLVLAGYMKLDTLAEQKITPHDRKKIIIAPHHTIEKNFDENIGLSNFLTYADLFKEIPKRYPQIDFIFRPHPLLKVTLEKDTVWGKEKTEKYFEEIQQNSNMIYQEGGDYFETFANSDGIIHDCSSFLAEYMFTEKPVCYMLRNKDSIEKYFMENGKEILSHCYQAYKKQDIIDFLDDVIMKNNDPMAQARIEFVNSELKVNYPHVSDFVLNYLKNAITGD